VSAPPTHDHSGADQVAWLTLIVVLLDRSHESVDRVVPLTYFPHVVIPNWFNIILSRNPGIAFSFFFERLKHLDSSDSHRWLGADHRIDCVAAGGGAGRERRQRSGPWRCCWAARRGTLPIECVHGAVTDFLEVWVRLLAVFVVQSVANVQCCRRGL